MPPAGVAAAAFSTLIRHGQDELGRFATRLGSPFYDKELAEGYPLSAAEFAAIWANGSAARPPFGHLDRLVPLMRKLASGEPAAVVMIGGSMQTGSGCKQQLITYDWRAGAAGKPVATEDVTGKGCCWLARLEGWLRHVFPRANLTVTNLAMGGASAVFFLSDIAAVAPPGTSTGSARRAALPSR